MREVRSRWLVLALFLLSPQSFAPVPDPQFVRRMINDGFIYDQHTAAEKVQALYHQISRQPYAYEDCPSVITEVFPFAFAAIRSYRTRGLKRTIQRKGPEYGDDEAPKYKLFHTYGASFMFEWTPTANEVNQMKYSGIFSENRAMGIGRWSQAGPVAGLVGWVPALSLKFPRDYANPDADLLVMNGLDPVSDGILYQPLFKESRPMTNILPRPYSPIMMFVNYRFESVMVKGQGVNQAVEHVAQMNVKGERPTNVRYPVRLIFQGHPAAASYEGRMFEDFRYMAEGIPVGTPLYEVFALDEEQNRLADQVRDVAKKIKFGTYLGRITLKSVPVASFYGDHMLHVGHSDRWAQDNPLNQ